MRVRKPDVFALLTLFVGAGVVLTSLAYGAQGADEWPGIRLAPAPAASTEAAPGLAADLLMRRDRQALRLATPTPWLRDKKTIAVEFGVVSARPHQPAWYRRIDDRPDWTISDEFLSSKPFDMSYVRIEQDFAGFGVTFGLATESGAAADEREPTVFFGINNRW